VVITDRKMAWLLAVIRSRAAGLLASAPLLAVIRRSVETAASCCYQGWVPRGRPSRYATVTTATELAGTW
jgi:hypothetical protein